MNSKPILFNGDMVRALLDGRKFQTRRVFKVTGPTGGKYPVTSPEEEIIQMDDGSFHYLSTSAMSGPYLCPYGQPGDLLIPAMPIPSLNRNYCADIYGQIWSKAKGEWKTLKGAPTDKGYLSVTPAHNGKYATRLVHRLVCEAWHGEMPAELKQVRHLDGNQTNNAPDNLDWGTQENNWTDRAFHGRAMGVNHHASKLSEKEINEIKVSNLSQRKLAALYSVSQSQIWCVKSNKTWRDDYEQDPPNMPRWASRLTLKITDVRVERVQDISEEDAEKEGISMNDYIDFFGEVNQHYSVGDICEDDPVSAFRELWDSINDKRGYGWRANPWVWVVEFEVIHQNINAVQA